MVLIHKIILIVFCLVLNIKLNAQNAIIFTDKYDVNYYSSSTENNSHLYLASDLFQFLESEQLNNCKAFIDSFLSEEKINFDKNFEFINNNTFVINLSSLNIISCKTLADNWKENYKIKFQEKLFTFLNLVENDAGINTSKNLIFKEIIKNEKSRFFNQANTLSNVNLSFIIPKKLTGNNFNIVNTHLNTKRYTSRETPLSATEIIYNNDISANDIKFSFPTMGRNTFLKICFAMTIIELLYQEDLNFELDYSINQVFASYILNNKLKNIDSLHYHFNKLNFSEIEFSNLKQKALNKINVISENNFFYYSFYDIEKLKHIAEKFSIKDYHKQIDILNAKRNFVLEINEASNIFYKNQKLIATNIYLLNKTIQCKTNSIEFLLQKDSIMINRLKVFLTVNNKHKLSINGIAKANEFLYIEKNKRDALLNKYESFALVTSRKRKLALFRALSIFDKLYDAGISYKRMLCSGIKGETPSVSFNLYIND